MNEYIVTYQTCSGHMGEITRTHYRTVFAHSDKNASDIAMDRYSPEIILSVDKVVR
ncbi:MAG: hypothetical protein KAS32_02720 [Candidatus Peribacteraceae bacterium]|nr:hypothetical protein [Candidatus Peribacteraceae bacterium]